MPLFALHCLDKPDSATLRAERRDDHVAHVRAAGITRFAGALLGGDGAIIGSMAVVETDDIAAAQGFVANDPFTTAGLYRQTDIHPFRLAILDLDKPGS